MALTNKPVTCTTRGPPSDRGAGAGIGGSIGRVEVQRRQLGVGRGHLGLDLSGALQENDANCSPKTFSTARLVPMGKVAANDCRMVRVGEVGLVWLCWLGEVVQLCGLGVFGVV